MAAVGRCALVGRKIITFNAALVRQWPNEDLESESMAMVTNGPLAT